MAATGIRSGGNGDGPEYYCHQHKDQAHVGQLQSGRRKESVLREKSSIETLVQRLGIQEKSKKANKSSGKWDYAGEESQTSLPGRRKENRPAGQKKKKPGFWASLCCGGAAQETDDYVEIIRHRKRLDAQAGISTQSVPGKRPASRPVVDHKTDSNTATNNLLALLPTHLSPETTSTLLAELVKPISAADEEGYIYIYWLTTNTPDKGTKRNLLAPPEKKTARRVSDVLSADHSTGTRPGTIMLKIGRANNVARRMKEWEKQCGFKLNLLRWYPYLKDENRSSPGLPSPSKDGEGKKVPYVKRVERLIHLELAGQQVSRQCKACGKEHREWFEVEATREGVRDVDGVVRRWVGWAEGHQG